MGANRSMSWGVSQREDWDGETQKLSLAWTLHKEQKVARCAVWSHALGWELRLAVGSELVRSQVVRSHEELVNICMRLARRDAQ